MKVQWLHYRNGYTYTTDITEAVSSITWGGSTSQAARTAEISVINAPNDAQVNQLQLKIAAGDTIQLYEETLFFMGEVITKETISETGTVTYSCTDLLNHLLKSTGIYNFSDTTPEEIAMQVCTDFSIKTGRIVLTNTPIKKMIVDGSSIYDIIMMAYTKAAKQTGKKYICRMDGCTLNVEEKGTLVNNFVLAEEYNITNSRQEETIDNMINLVKIYDDTGKQIGEVENAEWVEKYGIYQQIYKKEKDIDAVMVAENMLKGIENKVTLDGIEGPLDCIAGNGVEVYDKATGLNGLFWIDSDTHTWENGVHTMSLELNFQNIMDSREYTESDEQEG